MGQPCYQGFSLEVSVNPWERYWLSGSREALGSRVGKKVLSSDRISEGKDKGIRRAEKLARILEDYMYLSDATRVKNCHNFYNSLSNHLQQSRHEQGEALRDRPNNDR